MALKCLEQFARCYIPKPDCFIIRARSYHFTIRRKGNRVNRT
ncbi:hypothetical protein BOTCAL_2853g00020 [Botryotinia calthae]|uniref:Uncharacterized protein n=1 Tax=Botryotinia calthae TaxID=38488 RepID=A0A4Y8C7U5_9HELO|nr:hypothetical protein BOTCAL_2853g00020 [Botryotinia calthae]